MNINMKHVLQTWLADYKETNKSLEPSGKRKKGGRNRAETRKD